MSRTKGAPLGLPGALRSSISASAGVTVRATSSDTMIAKMYAVASGRKNEPATPPRKKIGRHTKATMKLA